MDFMEQSEQLQLVPSSMFGQPLTFTQGKFIFEETTMMKQIENTPLVCTLLPANDRQEKDGLWSELKAAFISSAPLRNGFRLQFQAPPALLERIGRLISLERSCCEFLHIRLDVPPVSSNGSDVMDVSLMGGKGVKTFLENALHNMGLPTISATKNNRWITLGISGILFGIICCALPFVFVALGMASVAHWFAVLDRGRG